MTTPYFERRLARFVKEFRRIVAEETDLAKAAALVDDAERRFLPEMAREDETLVAFRF
jgi:hypothetical protein